MLIDGKCCTTWTLIVGVPHGTCGLCEQRPVLVPGTERSIAIDESEVPDE